METQNKVKLRLKRDSNNFYDPNKKYFAKQSFLNDYEKVLFNILEEKLNKKYIVFPQINLQSIIETNTKSRNNELYRNIDFGIFDRNNLCPILMIELNGKIHKDDEYTITRDISIRNILNDAGIKLITITSEDLRKMNTFEIFKKIQFAIGE